MPQKSPAVLSEPKFGPPPNPKFLDLPLRGEEGLINFPPTKRGGLIREGGLNRGFTVFTQYENNLFLQMLFLVETSDSQKNVCICRLHAFQ